MTDMEAKQNDLVELTAADCDEVAGGRGRTIIRAGKAAISGINTIFGASAAGNPPRRPRGLNFGSSGGSDIRLKTAIRVEGEIAHLGLSLYSWEYTALPGERFVGVMAQDLLARADLAPAVFTFVDGPFAGYYGVDYARLGLRCLPADDFAGDVSALVIGQPALV